MTDAKRYGHIAGIRARYKFFLPEPYPPYPLYTQEANEWLHSFRMARHGCDWQEENRDAIDLLKKVLEDDTNSS